MKIELTDIQFSKLVVHFQVPLSTTKYELYTTK